MRLCHLPSPREPGRGDPPVPMAARQQSLAPCTGPGFLVSLSGKDANSTVPTAFGNVYNDHLPYMPHQQ